MLDPHERRAWKNHGQNLFRLAERGGLAEVEVLAILDDVQLTSETLAHYKPQIAQDELARRVTEWETAQVSCWTLSPNGRSIQRPDVRKSAGPDSRVLAAWQFPCHVQFALSDPGGIYLGDTLPITNPQVEYVVRALRSLVRPPPLEPEA
jgi:hypothetical protein